MAVPGSGVEARQQRKPWAHGNFGLQTYVSLVACVAMATVVLSGLLIHFQRNLLRRHILETGSAVSSFLAETLKVGIFAENAEEIRTAILPVLRESQVVGVAVYNRDQALLQSGHIARGAGAVQAWTPAIPESELAGIAASGGVVHQEQGEAFTFWRAVRGDAGQGAAEGLYFRDPLTQPARTDLLGYVAVAVSTEPLRQGVQAIVARSVAVGLVFLLVGSLVTFLVVRSATRPLHRLVEQVRAHGVTDASQDELGLLSDTFTNLVETLNQSFATINELRLGLEHKVAERTGELSAANRELQRENRERRRAEEELKQARDELECRVQQRTAELETLYQKLLHSEKLSALGTLTASIAHELNNPLFAIRAAIETLEYEARGQGIDVRLAQVAIQECDRISRLIRDMQDFYRPTSGNAVETDLHQAIESVLLLCRKDLLVRRIRVDTRYGEGVPKVSAVADQIKQVVLNLVTNARDAMGDGGTIEIQTEADEDRVRIHFRDTGKGIPAKDLKSIFEPFFSTKAASRGTGLGLSITQGIVKRHGGDIQVESEVGQGTHFTVSLPVRRQPEAEESVRG